MRERLLSPRPVRAGLQRSAVSKAHLVRTRLSSFAPSSKRLRRRISPSPSESEMRVLVVGAGAIGGYFGGRLLEAGRDVSFLVRSRRGAQLARTGLVIRSRLGDIDFSAPPTVTADALRQSFDLVLLGCKAYDLVEAMTSFAPAVGPNTARLAFLNGIQPLDALDV